MGVITFDLQTSFPEPIFLAGFNPPSAAKDRRPPMTAARFARKFKRLPQHLDDLSAADASFHEAKKKYRNRRRFIKLLKSEESHG